MLTELLRVLSAGGLHATDEVARRLGVSEALVAEMVEGLARRGYLAPVGSECDSAACSGCAVGAACEGGRPARIMALTEKGRQAVRALSSVAR